MLQSHAAPGRQRAASISLLLTLLFSLLCLAYAAKLEFGPLRGQALQVDELFFSACAARVQATGEAPNASCHDNKGPIIYLVHGWLLGDTPPYYDITAVKRAAFAAVLLLAAGVAWLAFMLGGAAAAVVAPALLLQALTVKADLLALKTEIVGMILLLACLGLLLWRPRRPGRPLWTLFAAGLLLGLAAMTKQTYAVLSLPIMLWLLLGGEAGAGLWRRLRSRLGRLVCFGLGALLPFCMLLTIYVWQGREADFLASFFAYPAVYGHGPPAHLERLLARISLVLDFTVSARGLLCLGFVIATAHILRQAPWRGDPKDGQQQDRLLILLCALPLMALMCISPAVSFYHPVPSWILMAVLAGTVVGDLWRSREPAHAGLLRASCLTLCAAALLSLNHTWRHNAGLGSTAGKASSPPAFIADATGQYGFLLGMPWPEFYTANGLVPASDLMFPWALPGMTAFWAYTPPPPQSRRGAALAEIHARNLRRLFDDFRHTPPRHIGVISEMARAAGSKRISDVPGFDAYLSAHCEPNGEMKSPEAETVLLFRCDGRPD